jgi:hypothetical protein
MLLEATNSSVILLHVTEAARHVQFLTLRDVLFASLDSIEELEVSTVYLVLLPATVLTVFQVLPQLA